MAKKRIPNILMKVRKELGLSASEVARRLGIPRSTYTSWEAGVCYPPLDKAYQIAKIYGKSIEELWLLKEGGGDEGDKP